MRTKGPSCSWACGPQPELVIAGSPCQPWSAIGRQRRWQDPWSHCLLAFVRKWLSLEPAIIIYENVPLLPWQ
eukprot:9172232-Alexandrium_andersonii.AAC.1